MLISSLPERKIIENMRLNTLVHRLKDEDLLISHREGTNDVIVRGLKEDSRAVERGDLFFACRGTRVDGHRFVPDALERGASALVCEEPPETEPDVPVLLVENARKALGHCSDQYYSHPSRDVTVIGITGTNGKTTTASLIYRLLNGLGYETGMLGTINNRYGDRIIPSDITTPPSDRFHSLLDQMREVNCKFAVAEISSHALDQHRTAGVRFGGAVFTNLTRDHLDYHGDMDSYAASKARLFQQLAEEGTALVNCDDLFAETMLEHSSGQNIGYGLESETASLRGTVSKASLEKSEWSFQVGEEQQRLTWKLPGSHNVANGLAAVGIVHALTDEPLERIARELEGYEPVEGRLDPVPGSADFSVFIDYAHTPDALENVLKNVKPLATGNVRAVFGCGGDRDRGKRPIMGRTVETYADHVYVTSDNPRGEDPEAIIQDILEGIRDRKRSVVEVDREKAIQRAIEEAEAGDVVLIFGKGHETVQKIDGTARPFEDKKVARSCLNSLNPIPESKEAEKVQ